MDTTNFSMDNYNAFIQHPTQNQTKWLVVPPGVQQLKLVITLQDGQTLPFENILIPSSIQSITVNIDNQNVANAGNITLGNFYYGDDVNQPEYSNEFHCQNLNKVDITLNNITLVSGGSVYICQVPMKLFGDNPSFMFQASGVNFPDQTKFILLDYFDVTQFEFKIQDSHEVGGTIQAPQGFKDHPDYINVDPSQWTLDYHA